MKEMFKKLGTQDIRNILAVMIVLGCFILLYSMQLKAIPAENKDIVLTAIGFVFGGSLAGVIGYYFGDSKKNQDTTK